MNPPELPTPPAAVPAGPDWASIAHEVHCPLCDYNLRGIREPRCPECGYHFAWPEMLNPQRKNHPYLFEHHPERNTWSFCRTATGAWRPRAFWELLHPAQRSRPGRLVAYWLLGIPLLVLAAACVYASAARVRMNEVQQRRADQERALHRNPVLAQSLIAGYGSMDAYLDQVVPSVSFMDALTSWGNQRLLRRTLVSKALILPLVWPIFLLAALLIFQISMRRARIKTIHVLRTVFYSFDLVLWAGVLTAAAAALSFVWEPDWVVAGTLLVRDVTVVLGAYRVGVAYRSYLRFDRPFATAASALIISVLLVMTLECLIDPRTAYQDFLAVPLLGLFVRGF